jgi:hypothetical protein
VLRLRWRERLEKGLQLLLAAGRYMYVDVGQREGKIGVQWVDFALNGGGGTPRVKPISQILW